MYPLLFDFTVDGYTFKELPNSRTPSYVSQESMETTVTGVLSGCNDPDEGFNVIWYHTPRVFNGLPRREIKPSNVDSYHDWRNVTESKRASEVEWTITYRGTNIRYGFQSITYDSGSGTQTITRPINTREAVGLYHSQELSLVGWNGSEVSGIDIDVPCGTMEESWTFDPRIANSLYIRRLKELRGSVNNAPWRGVYAAGEVKFVDATVTKAHGGEVNIDFSFEFSPNESNIVIGNLPRITKYGHEIIDIAFSSVNYDATLVNRATPIDDDSEEDTPEETVSEQYGSPSFEYKYPRAAFVRQVRPYIDFALLGIGTQSIEQLTEFYRV